MEISDLIHDNEVRRLSKEKLLEYCLTLNNFAKDSLIDGSVYLYAAVNHQVKELSKQIYELDVNLEEDKDSDKLDRLLKYMEKSGLFSKNLEEIQKRMIKPSSVKHILEAEEGSIEDYIFNSGKK